MIEYVLCISFHHLFVLDGNTVPAICFCYLIGETGYFAICS